MCRLTDLGGSVMPGSGRLLGTRNSGYIIRLISSFGEKLTEIDSF